MKSRKASIKAVDLTAGYIHGGRPRPVLSGINGALHAGEFVSLLGPNGCGKSTLLRTLGGFQPPLGGRVEVCGRDIAECGASELSRLLGVVLTDRVSVSDMAALQVVETGRSPYTGFWGTLSDADRQIAREAMERVGACALARKPVTDLSDGERQKVMIAKALAQQTPVLFLDEPTAFLDYPSKVEILSLLSSLAHEQGLAVMMSTHDLELTLRVCDRVWLLDPATGLRIDTPEALLEDGTLGRVLKYETEPRQG